jgi:hypothetical protein
MKRFGLFFLLVFMAAFTNVEGQERQLENKFFKDRERIAREKIREIKESLCGYWKAPCSREKSEINFVYKFDRKGNLIEADRYYLKRLRQRISYGRNDKGDYDSKKYSFCDSLGNISWTADWSFQFNNEGKRIRESWKNNKNVTVRVNEISYDERGNALEQLTDGSDKWTFQYDKKNNVAESREWRIRNDSLICIKITNYKYENGRLISEIVRAPKGNFVLNEFSYKYDSDNHLVAIVEKQNSWEAEGNKPIQKHTSQMMTILENDKNGNVLVKSSHVNSEVMPVECYYYEYTYWESDDN